MRKRAGHTIRKKNKNPRFIVKSKHIVFGVVSSLAGIVFTTLILFPVFSHAFYPPVPETNDNEVHVLPPDIKKVLGAATPVASYAVPILMYHYVEYVQDAKDTIRQSLDITPNVFEEQLITLKKAGYTFMTARQLGDVLNGRENLPPKPILLTFDDGYRDFYTDAYPILKKYHIAATAYIVPGFLDKPNYMFASQVEDLVKDGLVEIGAHTVHHVWLKGMASTQVHEEILTSKKMLESQFHIRVVSFAYPYGAFDTQAVNIVKDSGFWTGVSTVPGIDANINNRLFLYRLRPGGRTGEDLLGWLSRYPF